MKLNEIIPKKRFTRQQAGSISVDSLTAIFTLHFLFE